MKLESTQLLKQNTWEILNQNQEGLYDSCTLLESNNITKKKKPYWLSRHTFISLLNLSKAMKLYGPLANL